MAYLGVFQVTSRQCVASAARHFLWYATHLFRSRTALIPIQIEERWSSGDDDDDDDGED